MPAMSSQMCCQNGTHAFTHTHAHSQRCAQTQYRSQKNLTHRVLWTGGKIGSNLEGPGLKVESPKTEQESDFLKVLRPLLQEFHTEPNWPAEIYILKELFRKHTECRSFTFMSTWWERCANSPSRHTHSHTPSIADVITITSSEGSVLTVLSWIRLEKQTERQKDTPHLHYRMTLTERESVREGNRVSVWKSERGRERGWVKGWSLLAPFITESERGSKMGGGWMKRGGKEKHIYRWNNYKEVNKEVNKTRM